MRHHPTVLMLILGVATLASVACGGSSSSGGGSGTSQTEEGFCASRSSRQTACAPDGGGGVSFSRESCGKDYRCTVAIARAPDAYFACRTQTDCNASTSDDTCLARSAAGVSRPEADTCAKKYASCKAAGGKTFDDELCSALPALRDDVLAKLAPCFDKDCKEVGPCVDATAKAISIDCD